MSLQRHYEGEFSDNEESDFEVEYIPHEQSDYDPADDLFESKFKSSSSDVVIVHDDEWCYTLSPSGNDIPSQLKSKEEIAPSHHYKRPEYVINRSTSTHGTSGLQIYDQPLLLKQNDVLSEAMGAGPSSSQR
ncbi:hypothetical protein SERLA73DRAFT_125730 [Serpula lacrymans var. lacrymans S7.3]|uniref:Uncharacterized protein n=2 Tax=Serpula lacrymans var. lacrymans TaxID=341189 RepID=F8Q9V0_SERL3|nr:hypothetical protein SERLA73DRAFT_125730 [Serpula lacrymans var. lacrymans S7.3]